MSGMKTYIVTCRTSDGNLRERHIEAANHVAATKAIAAEGLEIVSIDRDDDGESTSRSRKRWKGLILSILFGLMAAAACVAFVWYRVAKR